MLTLSAKRSLHPVSRTIGFSRRPTESILLQAVNRRLNMPGVFFVEILDFLVLMVSHARQLFWSPVWRIKACLYLRTDKNVSVAFSSARHRTATVSNFVPLICFH